MKWFGKDFGGSYAAKKAFAVKYLPREQAQYLQNNLRRVKVKYLDYDWNLNSWKAKG